MINLFEKIIFFFMPWEKKFQIFILTEELKRVNSAIENTVLYNHSKGWDFDEHPYGTGFSFEFLNMRKKFLEKTN